MAMFAQFERAFDRIWNVESERDVGILKSIKRIALERFRAFLMLCGLGILVLAIFIAGVTISAIEEFASHWLPIPTVLRTLTEWGVSLVLNTLVFTLLYRLLPKVDVRWREAFRGAILVAAGWEIGRHVLSAVLMRMNYISATARLVLFWRCCSGFIMRAICCSWVRNTSKLFAQAKRRDIGLNGHDEGFSVACSWFLRFSARKSPLVRNKPCGLFFRQLLPC